MLTNNTAMTYLLIGGGNMGLTFARAMHNARITHSENLMVLEKSPEKIAYIQGLNICRVKTSPACIRKAKVIILAVKPQDASQLFASLRPHVNDCQLFLSIMAGIPIANIEQELSVNKIVRAMPNLPAQVGSGMTAFTATDAVEKSELTTIQNLLSTTGKTLYLQDERLIDAVTAISGSGPAYVYYFMEALIDTARQMGFNEAEAELLVGETFQGAIDLYHQSGDDCKTWIARVASRGGTTEAAVAIFQQYELQKRIGEGAQAALKRAISLGQ